MSGSEGPLVVRWTRRLEQAEVLDGPVQAIEPTIRSAFGSGTRGALLRGDWLGHALHPVLTDVVIGTWTSATILDLLGGEQSAGSSRRLIGVGLAAFAPTAWTGWAQWSDAGPQAKRVGLVHAVTNGVAAGLYASSWLARRRGHGSGARLALAGAAVLGTAGYLGGHVSALSGERA